MKMWINDDGEVIHDTTRFRSLEDLIEDVERSFERNEREVKITKLRTSRRRYKREEKIKRPLRNYYSDLD